MNFKSRLFLFVLLVEFCKAVRITNLTIPSIYVLYDDSLDKIILDCEFEMHPKDVAFVLKWYHENHLIYQWIPPKMPYAFNNFKSHINTSYVASSDDRYRHRALQLINPMWNLSGNFMCTVATYYSRDWKIGKLQMIVPEENFFLTHNDLELFNDNYEFLFVKCSVENIYPEPDLKISIGKFTLPNIRVERVQDDYGLHNKSVLGKISKYFLEAPSAVSCILKINGTTYIKRKQSIFYDQKFNKQAYNEHLSYYASLNTISNNGSFVNSFNLLLLIIFGVFLAF